MSDGTGDTLAQAMVDAITYVDGVAIDALGNPMVKTTGCPSCGKGEGWLTIIEYAGKMNSLALGMGAQDPNGPCSRVCTQQLEWAAVLKAKAHRPRRDDDVAAWLKRMRDAYPEGDATARFAVDRLLDRYRECADHGLTLRLEDDERGDP
jgi:hypothetical protein